MHGILVIHAKKINKTGKEVRKRVRLGYSFIMYAGTALQIKCYRNSDLKEAREEVMIISI